MRTRRATPARRASIGLVLALLAACAPADDERLDAAHAGAMRDSVAAMLDDVAASLAAEGPMAWLRFFEDSPAFLMASDGRVAFPGRDSAQTFLAGFARSVTDMRLGWDAVRIEPIAPGIAAIAASYHESIGDTAGAVTAFRGYVTAVARNDGEEWRLQHLHWSSPADSAR